MSDWYVLQTKARQERVAEHQLNNQYFSTFLPMLSANKRVRGKWARVREPLFPGYLFIELDMANQNTAPIRSTRGVLRLVRLGDTIRPFPIDMIHALKQAQSIEGEAIDPSRLFSKGDEVVLMDGPMKGLTAIFKARNSQERVVLLLTILGTQTQLSVSPHLIQKVS